MKRLLLLVVSLVLIVAPIPIWAQSAQAAPIGGDITPSGLLVAGAAIAVAIVTGIFALVARYVDNRLAAAKAEQAEELSQAQNQTKLIEAINTLGKGMSDQSNTAAKDREAASADRKTLLDIVETRGGAKQGRDDAVKVVNEHIDSTAKELREPLSQAVAALESASSNVKTASDTISKVVTSEELKQELKQELKPILRQLELLGESVGALIKRSGADPFVPPEALSATDPPSSTHLTPGVPS